MLFVNSYHFRDRDKILFMGSLLKKFEEYVSNRMIQTDDDFKNMVDHIMAGNYHLARPLCLKVTAKKVELESDYLSFVLLCVVGCASDIYSDYKSMNTAEMATLSQICIAATKSNDAIVRDMFRKELANAYGVADLFNFPIDQTFLGNPDKAIKKAFDDIYNIMMLAIIGLYNAVSMSTFDDIVFRNILQSDKAYMRTTKTDLRTFCVKQDSSSAVAGFSTAFRQEFMDRRTANPHYFDRLIHIGSSIIKSGRKMRKNDIFDSIIMLHLDYGYEIKTYDEEFKAYLASLSRGT